MDQPINYKLKIDFLISNNTNNTSLINITQNTSKSKSKFKKCNECNRSRKFFNEIHQICYLCYGAKKTIIPSGNKVVDDFIRYTLTNRSKKYGKMEFVPYDNFKVVEFVAEGGFSKIYKATWIDGPITNWNKKKQKYYRRSNTIVALKELDNSQNINSKELNEVFYLILVLY